jgi:UDP-N-acetylglucosamine 2-epimerase
MMSETFFEELGIQEPAYNLGVGLGTHAQQTADILVKLYSIFLSEIPDAAIILGHEFIPCRSVGGVKAHDLGCSHRTR